MRKYETLVFCLESSGRKHVGRQSPLDEEALAFQVVVTASIKNLKAQPSYFVKKFEEIPRVKLPPSSSRREALALVDQLVHRNMAIFEHSGFMASK
jgi:hypothetical protein